MKYVIDAQSIVENRTGIGRYVYNLIVYMQKELTADEIIPFFFNFRKKEIGQKIFKNRKGEIKFIPGTLLNQLWKISNVLPVDTFTGNADIIHFPNYLMKPVKSGKKIITVCDMAFKRFSETINPKNLSFLNESFVKSLSKADALITISEFSKKEILHFYPDINIPVYVTPLGVDDFFNIDYKPTEIKRVQEAYSLPDKYILHVGTLEPRKNLSLLLKAFALVKEELANTKLVLAGTKGWLNKEFFTLLEELDLKQDVVFPGFIKDSDLPLIYKGACLFIFPTKYEGFGIPPLEAMAASVPVIASDIEVLKEILADSAEFFSLSSGEEALAFKIRDLLSDTDRREELIVKGLRRSSGFSWKTCAEKTLSVYQQTME